jgi:AraC family transcriptional regulator
VVTRWEKLKAAQRMQEYIETHLGEPITLAALARAARYSQWYAARIFKECTGKTPFEYIRLRRLTVAAGRLASERVRVIDVAFDFVFDSHDGFTRAFARQFGMTPSRYRQMKPTLDLFLPLEMRAVFTARQKGAIAMKSEKKNHTVFVQIVDRPARKLVLKRGVRATHYFEYCEEVGCDIWDVLAQIKGALGEPMGLWLPAALCAEGTSTYVQGVEVPLDFTDKIPEGYDVIELRPCKQMVFQGPPFDDAKFEEAIDSLWDAINGYQPETVGYAWADDDAPRFQLAPFGYRGYIEGRPVRQLDTRPDHSYPGHPNGTEHDIFYRGDIQGKG